MILAKIQQGAFRSLQEYNQLVSGFFELRERAQSRKQLHCSRKHQACTENERSVCYIVDCNRGKLYCSPRTLRWMYGRTTAGQGECCSHIAGLVHFADPQSMDYPIWTTKWTTLMDSQMDYLDGLPIWTT